MHKLYIKCVDELKEVKLPLNISNHINRYANAKARKESLAAWSLLCNKIDLNDVVFSKNGKPYLKNNQSYFSLSHCDGLVAVTISDKPIGLDIQSYPKLAIANLLASNIFSPDKLAKYKKAKNKRQYLTKYWTMKEAYNKLNDLSLINVKKDLDETNYKFVLKHLKMLNKNYYVCICKHI